MDVFRWLRRLSTLFSWKHRKANSAVKAQPTRRKTRQGKLQREKAALHNPVKTDEVESIASLDRNERGRTAIERTAARDAQELGMPRREDEALHSQSVFDFSHASDDANNTMQAMPQEGERPRRRRRCVSIDLRLVKDAPEMPENPAQKLDEGVKDENKPWSNAANEEQRPVGRRRRADRLARAGRTVQDELEPAAQPEKPFESGAEEAVLPLTEECEPDAVEEQQTAGADEVDDIEAREDVGAEQPDTCRAEAEGAQEEDKPAQRAGEEPVEKPDTRRTESEEPDAVQEQQTAGADEADDIEAREDDGAEQLDACRAEAERTQEEDKPAQRAGEEPVEKPDTRQTELDEPDAVEEQQTAGLDEADDAVVCEDVGAEQPDACRAEAERTQEKAEPAQRAGEEPVEESDDRQTELDKSKYGEGETSSETVTSEYIGDAVEASRWQKIEDEAERVELAGQSETVSPAEMPIKAKETAQDDRSALQERSETVSLLDEVPAPKRAALKDSKALTAYLREQFMCQPMLGSIEITKSEYTHVLLPWFGKIMRGMKSVRTEWPANPELCAALVQIAIWESERGDFWPYVGRHLGRLTASTMDKLWRMFEKTMAIYGKICFESNEKVASILMHAFACNAQVERLFDFLFAYYDIDIEHSIALADVERLRQTITSGQYFRRKQLLLNHTIDALTHFPQIGSKRLQAYLDWIDSAYFDVDFHPDASGRFARGFEAWRSGHPAFSADALGAGRARGRGQRAFRRPEILFDTRVGTFTLVLPAQRIEADWALEDVHWQMHGVGRERAVCEVVEGITACRTEEIRIPLPEERLLGRMTFALVADGRTMRSFVLEADCCRAFDEDGALVAGRHLKAGVIYAFTPKGARLNVDAPCDEQETRELHLARYTLQTGMVVTFPDDTLAIVGTELEEGLCGPTPIAGATVLDGEDGCYPVYAKMPSVLVKTTQERFEGGRMVVNGAFYPMRSLRVRRAMIGNRSEEQYFLVSLPDAVRGSLCVNLRVDLPGRESRNASFAHIDGFSYRFENDEPLPYLFAQRGSVTFFGDVRLAADGFEKHPTKNEFGFAITPDRDVLSFDLPDGGVRLELAIPQVKHRVPGGAWKTQRPDDVWHKNLPEKIELMLPQARAVFSVDKDGIAQGRSVEYARSGDGKTILCDLTPLRSWLGRDKIVHDIDLTVDGHTRPFVRVYSRSAVLTALLEGDFEQGTINGYFDIVGANRSVLSLYHAGLLVAEHVPIEEGRVKIQTQLESGLYEAVIYEEEEDEFGFDVQHHEIGRARCELIDPGNIEGRTFYLKRVLTIDRQSNELPMENRRFWVEVGQRIDEGHYKAVLRENSRMYRGETIRVTVALPCRGRIHRVCLTFDDDGEEQPFILDCATGRIVREEDRTMHRMQRYRRYVMLDPDDQFLAIYTKEDEDGLFPGAGI